MTAKKKVQTEECKDLEGFGYVKCGVDHHKKEGESLKKLQRQEKKHHTEKTEEEIDEAVEESFPASDPPANY